MCVVFRGDRPPATDPASLWETEAHGREHSSLKGNLPRAYTDDCQEERAGPGLDPTRDLPPKGEELPKVSGKGPRTETGNEIIR